MKSYKLLLSLLCQKHRFQMLFLQAFFLITALFQVGGVASIAPFIAVVSNPSLVESSYLISSLHDFLGASDFADFLISYAVLIGLFILIGNLIASLALWLLYSFSVHVGAELQDRLYKNYLANQYIFFAMNNSSSLVANLTQEIPRFVYMVLQPMLMLISQLFIVVIILAGLLYIDPALALISIGVIGGIYFFIFWSVRLKMVHAGEVITKVAKRKLVLLNESIFGIKEVKLSSMESWYERELSDTNRRGLNASAFVGLAGDVPKFIVETVVFSAILGLAIYLMMTRGADGSAMSTLSFYAMAGYKILPAAQTVYKAMSSIKANGLIMIEIKDELTRTEVIATKSGCGNADTFNENSKYFEDLNIELRDISFAFPGRNELALRNLNIFIKQHQLTSFVGSSGAGKSTAVDVILGLLSPSSGQVVVGSKVIQANTIRQWQKRISYVPQNIFLLDDTILKNIAFGVPEDKIDLKLAKAAAKKANIDSYITGLDKGYLSQVGERGGQLSGGQRQRIGIARALYQQPEVLILDEATSALDTITERQILGEIHELAKTTTIIMIAHRMSTVKNSDQIFVFDKGEIVGSGTYEALQKSSGIFNELVTAGEREMQKGLI